MSGRTMKKLLWRWRNNPLRRHDDILEAWTVLAMWVIIAVGGTLAGLVTAHAADDVLARQRAERQPARAVLLSDLPSATSAGDSAERVPATVRWTTSDGTAHTGRALVHAGQKAGSRVTVWLDAEGRLTTQPPSRVEAGFEAGLLGAAATLATAGTVFGGAAVVRWRLDRRRVDAWGREWAMVGPRWGHKTG
ncbi:Rv1733c family protein [Streptomyces sp. NPDC001617]